MSALQLLGSTRLLHMDGTQMLYRGQPARSTTPSGILWVLISTRASSRTCCSLGIPLRATRVLRDWCATQTARSSSTYSTTIGDRASPWQRIVAYQANNTASDEELCQSAQWIHDGVLNAGGSSSPAVGDDAGMLGRELERPSCSSRFVRVALAMEDQLCRRRAACRASGGGGRRCRV